MSLHLQFIIGMELGVFLEVDISVHVVWVRSCGK